MQLPPMMPPPAWTCITATAEVFPHVQLGKLVQTSNAPERQLCNAYMVDPSRCTICRFHPVPARLAKARLPNLQGSRMGARGLGARTRTSRHRTPKPQLCPRKPCVAPQIPPLGSRRHQAASSLARPRVPECCCNRSLPHGGTSRLFALAIPLGGPSALPFDSRRSRSNS